MLFKNANIFVGGKFRHGSFRAENGRFTEILTTVPAEGGIDLNDQYVIPGLVDVYNHGNSGADFPTAITTALSNGALFGKTSCGALCFTA